MCLKLSEVIGVFRAGPNEEADYPSEGASWLDGPPDGAAADPKGGRHSADEKFFAEDFASRLFLFSLWAHKVVYLGWEDRHPTAEHLLFFVWGFI